MHDSLRKLTDTDLHAIVAYLKSTPSKPSYVDEQVRPLREGIPSGNWRRISEQLRVLSSAQRRGHSGGLCPAWSTTARCLRMGRTTSFAILGGIEAQGSYAPMPAVGAEMTDQQVADVVNYVRQSWGNEAPPNAGPGEVGELRPKTFTAMNIGPDEHCPTVVQPGLAKLINDLSSGINDALRAMTLETVLQTAEKVAAKAKAAAPDAKPADIVNSLTIAYCPIVEKDAKIPADLKVPTLDHFSERSDRCWRARERITPRVSASASLHLIGSGCV